MTELDKDALEAAMSVLIDRGYEGEWKVHVGHLSDVIRAYLDAADDWRPIETAPKDGTDVLVSRRDAALEGE